MATRLLRLYLSVRLRDALLALILVLDLEGGEGPAFCLREQLLPLL